MLRCAPPGGAAAPHPDAFCAAGCGLPGRRLLLLLLLGLFLDGDAASPAAAASDLGMGALEKRLSPSWFNVRPRSDEIHQTNGRSFLGKCGVPKPVANARIVYENSHGNKLRYACLENFKRKAGTSSLIVCEQDAITRKYRWSPPQLVCIYLAVEDTTESHTTRETARPTQIQCTNPGRVPARLYGSQTTSPVVETSSFAPPPRGTAKPSSDSLGSTVTATSGGGWMTTGTVSKSVTPSPTRTPFSPDENINTQWTPQQTTSAPSEGPLGNTTDPTDTGVWQSITGSHYFKIGIPFFAVILSAGFVYYCYCARSRAPWRQARVPSVEVIPMDPLGSEGGRSASAGEAPDPGPANEEDPMLMGLPPPVE